MATTESWSDPERCPFCGAKLASPGAGFVDHTAESPDCETKFETWRDRITDDVAGGWSG
ncbi:hypothetical protein [Halosimplex sp. TS25]|uniref:DUF7501 family protein n=1 Tax=Halosimplex rarum TaxID=3396619 RepID=UPI0039E8C17D